jgi:hypothetical protein
MAATSNCNCGTDIIIGTIICSGGGGGIIAWLYHDHGITNIRSGSLLLLGIARIEPDYGIDDNI